MYLYFLDRTLNTRLKNTQIFYTRVSDFKRTYISIAHI